MSFYSIYQINDYDSAIRKQEIPLKIDVNNRFCSTSQLVTLGTSLICLKIRPYEMRKGLCIKFRSYSHKAGRLPLGKNEYGIHLPVSSLVASFGVNAAIRKSSKFKVQTKLN